MGAKTWLLIYSEGDVRSVLKSKPVLDREETRRFVTALHPGCRTTEFRDGSLLRDPSPPDGVVYAGCYPGLKIICSGEVACDYPSKLDTRFLSVAGKSKVYLHAMHSVVDWFAYAVWKEGKLSRALSVAPDGGVLENLGEALPFERAFWDGEMPVELDPGDEAYPLPFHPLEMGEEALRALFGFCYEGKPLADDPELESIVLSGFKVDRGPIAVRLGRWLLGKIYG